MRFFLKLIIAMAITSALFSQSSTSQSNTGINSFAKAKKLLHKVVYADVLTRKTFYCGCSYDSRKKVDHESCTFKHRKNFKRAQRVEWEHVVPAHAFGGSLPEWINGHPDCVTKKGKPFKGRKCASKMNKLFQFMQADMYNLVPSIGEVNGDRSNFSYGIVEGEKREYGKCDFEIENRTAEPAENIRGNIARIYMYMDSAYSGFGIINEKNKKMFEDWNKSDPVDLKECERNAEIEKIQGNQNVITKDQCDEMLRNDKK